MEESIFTWESKVRDYELDSQRIVNHATFLNYFEQCRNDYARSAGIDFHEYHDKGYDLVVASLEVRFHNPLKAEDEFYVTVRVSAYNEKRIQFEQEIKHKYNKNLVAKAFIYIACVDRKTGKTCMPDILKDQLPSEKYVEHRLG